MGVSIDTWLYSVHNVCGLACFLGKSVQAVKLEDIINDNSSHALLQRIGKLMVGLVVAVEAKLFGREAYAESCVKLTLGNNVQSQSLFKHYPAHSLAAERLACVAYKTLSAVILVHRLLEAAAVLTDKVLVHYIKRRAVFMRKLHSVYSAYGKVSFTVHSKIFRY